ncbi:glycosyltransferase family 58 protein [Mycena floridula]|nr:glycosyltransferase family 58 protein [Mycena floridula]
MDQIERLLSYPRLLFQQKYFIHLAAIIVLGDVLLTQLVVRFIPYTEIDWETYMVQIQVFLKGENDYSKITGPTGPLVYPAGHVYIHQFLYGITDSGKDIQLAQHIYASLHVISILFTSWIYYNAHAPNWTLLLLPFSKRLLSIYSLRLFNDCWSVLAVQAAIIAYQNNANAIATILFSLGLSVKMSALLYLPGLIVLLFLRGGFGYTIAHLTLVILVQLLVAVPFLQENWRTYLHFAFDFSRAFLYKWTVNWRMVPEETFVRSGWARTLLLGHLSVLVLFGCFRWCKKQGGIQKVLYRGLRNPSRPGGVLPVTSNDIATILFTSNLIGIIFARSLHYQFYSWYAQQIPFLAWKARYPWFLSFLMILVIEYAWNVYPSTQLSSCVLLGANVILLLGLWHGTR